VLPQSSFAPLGHEHFVGDPIDGGTPGRRRLVGKSMIDSR
jgi:hypothetical protein